MDSELKELMEYLQWRCDFTVKRERIWLTIMMAGGLVGSFALSVMASVGWDYAMGTLYRSIAAILGFVFALFLFFSGLVQAFRSWRKSQKYCNLIKLVMKGDTKAEDLKKKLDRIEKWQRL